MRFHSYLNSAVQILKQYKGEEPVASFLKKYFSANKKHGSKDRKQVSHLCYCYFRLGKSLLEIPTEERILIGLFLCSAERNEMLAQLKPEWNEMIALPLEKKLSIINYSLVIPEVFPWRNQLSNGIDHEKFCESFFTQSDLFLRIRDFQGKVKEKLLKAGIDFKEMNPACLVLPNASKIESVIELDKEAVVQDYNSQQVGLYFKSAISNLIPIVIGTKINAWDCCAGSGGKSLLLNDINPHIDLTVSDVRETILINLKKRFAKAGIKKYKSFVADLASSQKAITDSYDLIICDAPCTGSGTWSRTPEQLYFFDENKIEQYAELQKKIVSNVILHLKENGCLVYITCSVFKKENDEMVEFVKKKFNLELIKMELLKGYDKKADTMFAALLTL
jgi:16S rRNA (cytosine967-C5)-methyltransferase